MSELPYKIFIVEDEPDVMDLITDAFKDSDVQISTSFSLKEARGNLKKTRPDMVILDRGFPDGDGLELCAEIRKDPQYQSVAVLMLTAQAETRDKVLGLNLGADDYVAKPFAKTELKARVDALRRRTEERAELRKLKADMEQLKAAHTRELEELAAKHRTEIEQVKADPALKKKRQEELAKARLDAQTEAENKIVEIKSGLIKQFDGEYTEQNKKFMAQINRCAEENEKLRSAKTGLEEAAVKLEAELLRKAEEAKSLEALLARKEKEFLSSDARSAAARQKLESDASTLGAAKAEFEQRCYGLEAEVKRRADEEAALKARLEALAAEKAAKETELAQTAQNLKAEGEKRAGLESELRTLKQKVQQLESQTGELTGRVEVERRNLAAAKEAAARNVQAAEAKAKELSAEVEKYKKMKGSFGERMKWAFKAKKEGEEEEG